MTERMRRFADFYIINPNATAAAIEAGYSAKTAYSIGERLLRNVEVQAAIQARNKELETSRIADLTECLSFLTQVMRGETTTERIQLTKEGIVRVPAKPAISERNRAAELRLKTLCAFVDSRVELQPQASGSEAVAAFEAALRQFQAKSEA